MAETEKGDTDDHIFGKKVVWRLPDPPDRRPCFEGFKLLNILSGSSASGCGKWLVHWPLVPEVPGFIPVAGKEKFGVRTRFPSCNLRDDVSTVRRPMSSIMVSQKGQKERTGPPIGPPLF